MGETGQDPLLAAESLGHLGIGQPVTTNYLDGYLAIVPRVVGQVHDTHSALPEPPVDEVVPHPSARLQVGNVRHQNPRGWTHTATERQPDDPSRLGVGTCGVAW